jgi:hypothetical protein
VEGHAEFTALLVPARNGEERDKLVRYRRTALPPVGFAGLRSLLVSGAEVGIPETARHRTTAAAWFGFPYTAGLRFFLDVYEAGGMALVGRTLVTPPRSTSEILHPARFLAGGAPFRLAEDPDGVLSMPLGEAMLVLMLERCVEPTRARRVAASYRGDLGTLRRNPHDGSFALEWESMWAGEAAAAEAETTFRTFASCPSMRDEDPEVPLAPEIQVVRRGSRVLLVRGRDVQAREGSPDRPQIPRPSPPALGATRPPPIFQATPGIRLEGTMGAGGATFANASLGLVTEIPFRTAWWTPSPSGVLTLFGKDRGFLASISAFRPPPDEDSLPLLEEVALAGAETDAGPTERFRQMNATASTLGGRPARVVTWRRDLNGEWLRVTSVPLCQGRLRVLVVDRWGGVDGLAALDEWRRSFAWTEPSLCRN